MSAVPNELYEETRSVIVTKDIHANLLVGCETVRVPDSQANALSFPQCI